MKLWQHIRRVLWAVGITTVLLLATVECLYRATLTHLPIVPPHMNGAVPVLLARAPWIAEEGSMVLQVRRLVPWTLLRVLTAILRARKAQSSSSESPRLPKPVALEWLLKAEELSPSASTALSRSSAAPGSPRSPSLHPRRTSPCLAC
jgi:hypothetical protein